MVSIGYGKILIKRWGRIRNEDMVGYNADAASIDRIERQQRWHTSVIVDRLADRNTVYVKKERQQAVCTRRLKGQSWVLGIGW